MSATYDSLESVKQQPITLSWETAVSGRHIASLTINNYETASFAGDFGHPSEETDSITCLPLRVGEAYRNNGLATRLISGLAHVAITNGARQMTAHVESPYAIKSFDTVFGDAVNYTDYDPRMAPVQLPMTNEQAVQSLERTSAFEIDLENRFIGIEATVDLSGIDPTTLEEPIETYPSEGSGAYTDQ